MDTVIKKISEIEAAAASVMDGANARKQAFAREIQEKTSAFDRQLDAETESRIDALRSQMEVNMNAQLSAQRSDAEHMLARMEQNYKDHHREYARRLFHALIEG